MKKISKNTENNIISLIDNGQSSQKIAEQLGISHTSVMRVSTRLRPNAQKKKAGQPAKLTTTDKRNIIRNLTSGKADTTVQLARDLKDSVQVDISPNTVCHTLKETISSIKTYPPTIGFCKMVPILNGQRLEMCHMAG